MGAGLEAWIHRTDRGARGVLDQAGVEHVGEHQVDLQVPHCLEEATRPARAEECAGTRAVHAVTNEIMIQNRQNSICGRWDTRASGSCEGNVACGVEVLVSSRAKV